MAKRRHKRRKAVRHSGEFMGRRKRRSHRRYHGEFMGRRKRSRRSGRYYGADKTGIMANVMTGVTTVAGAVAGSFVANKLPLDPKIKALLPMAAGVLLMGTKLGRKPLFRNAGLGMLVIGGISLLKQFAPAVPLLAGEDNVVMLPTNGEELAFGEENMGINAQMGVDNQGPENI